jgi:hypothetical protein
MGDAAWYVEDVACPVDDIMIDEGHRLIRIFRSEGREFKDSSFKV